MTKGRPYFAGDLRDISSDRRLATLAVCALEWRSAIADAVVETHDRIVGETWREAKRACDAQADDAKAALKDTLQGFSNLGSALLEAHEDEASLIHAGKNAGGWSSLRGSSPPLPNSPTHWLLIRWHMLFTVIR